MIALPRGRVRASAWYRRRPNNPPSGPASARTSDTDTAGRAGGARVIAVARPVRTAYTTSRDGAGVPHRVDAPQTRARSSAIRRA